MAVHYFSSRTIVMVFATRSICATLNGPAVTGNPWAHPVLNTAGSELVEVGYSGLIRACQSENWAAKVTTACLPDVPHCTEMMSL